MVSVCVQPLDVLRTRMQADAAAGRLQSTVKTLKAVLEAQGARYGFFPLSFFLSLLLFFPPRKHDPSRSRPPPPSLSFFTNRGLWAGSGPTVMRLSAGLAIQFLAIDSLKDFVATRAAKRRQLEEDGGRAPSSSRGRWAAGRLSAPPAPSAAAERPALTAGEAFLVGGGARTLSSALTSPLTLVKTRMEFAGSGGASTVQALAAIARAEGARGLLRGLGPTVAANAPFSALYYSFYSRLRVRFADAGAPAAASNFGAGLLAAAAATVLTQPADMVRTHMQLGLGGLGGGGAGPALGGAAGAALGGAAGAAAATGASVVVCRRRRRFFFLSGPLADPLRRRPRARARSPAGGNGPAHPQAHAADGAGMDALRGAAAAVCDGGLGRRRRDQERDRRGEGEPRRKRRE